MSKNERPLITYLSEHLKDTKTVDLFYSSPSTVLSVFRTLPILAKQMILRVLKLKEIPVGMFSRMKKSNPENAIDEIGILEKYRILEKRAALEKNASEKENYALKTSFITQLQNIFCYKYTPHFEETTVDIGMTKNELTHLSLGGWRKIHRLIVKRSSTQDSSVDDLLRRILECAKLIERGGQITSDGFQFILNSTDFQINSFIRYYAMYLIEKKGKQAVKVITILAGLNLCVCENVTNKEKSFYAYKIDLSDQDQVDIINNFSEFGLVWKHSKDNIFVVTPLLSHFLFEKSANYNTEGSLNIIVETNFRIYAYTDSEVHQELISNFAFIEYKLPNLLIASLREENVKNAFKLKQIKKEQIVNFLSKNIHPAQKEIHEKEKARSFTVKTQMSDDILDKIRTDNMYAGTENELIPENVLQQLDMWEKEKDVTYRPDKDDDSD